METNIKAQKDVAIRILRELDIFDPYIQGFEENGLVCFFERYIGFWLYQEPSAYEKMKEIEKEYGCIVYAVTHEYTEFGELYSYLIVTAYEEEWDTLVYTSGKRHRAFAYVWNKDDDLCSEFGNITAQSSGGGIKRIA